MKVTDSNVVLIREFFSTPEKPVTMEEIKNLLPEDRQELGEAIRAQLN